MTATIEVRRARLSDADSIAAFVNAAQSGVSKQAQITRLDVVERFGQIGFMIAQRGDTIVGLLGWQIENLVVRVTDYLVAAPGTDTMQVAQALVDNMETEAQLLRAESSVLILPAHPSPGLVRFWEDLGYDAECLDDLTQACREAVNEWGVEAERVMVKRLHKDPVGRPV